MNACLTVYFVFFSPLRFLFADIATISYCVISRFAINYLRWRNEHLPRSHPILFLPWHIKHILIYLIYRSFKAIHCFSRAPSVCQYNTTILTFSPHLKQCNLLVRQYQLFFGLFLYFFFKAKVISSVPSLFTAHAHRTFYFILL